MSAEAALLTSTRVVELESMAVFAMDTGEWVLLGLGTSHNVHGFHRRAIFTKATEVSWVAAVFGRTNAGTYKPHSSLRVRKVEITSAQLDGLQTAHTIP